MLDIICSLLKVVWSLDSFQQESQVFFCMYIIGVVNRVPYV